jgi:hypothetical protein
MSKIKASLTLENQLQEIDEVAPRFVTSPRKPEAAQTSAETPHKTSTSLAKKSKLGQHSSVSNPDKPSSSLTTSRLRSANDREKQPAMKRVEFPMTSKEAIRHFKNLNDYEIQESVSFDGQIYYTGSFCKNKVKGHPIKYVSQGDKMVPS